MGNTGILDDTIAAISTPIGQGGIGIVRLSGKDSLSIADKIFLPKDKEKPSAYKTRTVHYGWVLDRGKVIDEVLLTVMRSPASYTKEDIVEISCHSGIVVLREILDLVLASGARMAEPGEFTKRAFLNGRIDLGRAEAVLDIINAKTELALQSGLRQLQGALSDEINGLKDALLEAIALLEAHIDFPEEDIGSADKTKIGRVIKAAIKDLKILLDSVKHGKVLREGISAVILGRANVGKSSLLNALLKEERAIVTPIAGTTRDAIEEILDLKGIPLKIADTAGIIEPRDLIEEEAIRRTHRYFEKANLILLVFDASSPLTKQDKELIRKTSGKNVIAVLNKSDLKRRINEQEIKKRFAGAVKISARTHKGLKELEEKIIEAVWEGKAGASDEVIVTNARHAQALREALASLERAGDSQKRDLSIEFIVEDLKLCRNHLGRITGETADDEILDKIFSEFCIGK